MLVGLLSYKCLCFEIGGVFAEVLLHFGCCIAFLTGK